MDENNFFPIEYTACHRNSLAIDWECTCGFDGNMDANDFLRDIHT